ncbi:hypothetical protein QQ045_014901 [Rhodiola kirilowii]
MPPPASLDSSLNHRVPAIILAMMHLDSFLGTIPRNVLVIILSVISAIGIEWVQDETVTLFTADGLIQIGGSLVPRHVSSLNVFLYLYFYFHYSLRIKRLPRFKESDYMDPKQCLCLGALFDIASTNALYMGRRLCIFGFCRSIDMLSDVVEDTVLEHGGEVGAAQKAYKGGLHEKLTMKVAVLLLWEHPPASETLHLLVQNVLLKVDASNAMDKAASFYMSTLSVAMGI